MSAIQEWFTAPRFDWYQVTFFENVDPMKVLESAYIHFETCSMQVADRVEVKQYKRAVNAYLDDERLFHLAIGGAGGDRPHIKATGSKAHMVYEWLSKDWPACYGVSRADVCFDTTEPGIFEYLSDMGKRYCVDHRVKANIAGDWDSPVGQGGGKTRYMGSPASQAMVRIYEKGLQMSANPDWVRLEFQVRPSKAEDKKKVGLMLPIDVIHSVPWCSNFLAGVFHDHLFDASGFVSIASTWEKTRSDRALVALVKQYGNVLDKLADSLPGGWSDVGLALNEVRAITQEVKSAKGGMGLNPYRDLVSRLLAAA